MCYWYTRNNNMKFWVVLIGFYCAFKGNSIFPNGYQNQELTKNILFLSPFSTRQYLTSLAQSGTLETDNGESRAENLIKGRKNRAFWKQRFLWDRTIACVDPCSPDQYLLECKKKLWTVIIPKGQCKNKKKLDTIKSHFSLIILTHIRPENWTSLPAEDIKNSYALNLKMKPYHQRHLYY